MKAILGGRKYEDDQNPFSTPVEIKPKSILLQDKELNAIVPYQQAGLPQASLKHNRNNVLVHLQEEEEDRERDSVRLVVEKYSQLFKFLFDKYTSHQKR